MCFKHQQRFVSLYEGIKLVPVPLIQYDCFALLFLSFFYKYHYFHSFSADINIWLVTFGFHLHNAIPGFPIPKFDLILPSLEMKKSQLWDDLPVCILR